ncbi:6-bladed beta-propeller [Algoriphagus sp.]|uniref:6-bladed beta-propeller n=1 Tax=Algoriphagus sp. TaxID=1872435 RepID=UPI00261D640D|nr:6-bladed beta-propeller [Algoriphagus sp.]
MSKNLILFLVVLNFSCTRVEKFENSSLEEIEIDLGDTIDLRFTDFFDTTLIVPLEVTENSLLGEATKVITTESFIFVLDRHVSESLYIFDYKGKLINFFSGTGNGPNEFLRVTNFYLSKDSDIVFIQDSSLSKILAFNFDGELIFEKKFDFRESFNDMIPYEDGYLILKPSLDNLSIELEYLDQNLDFVETPLEFIENDFLLEAGSKFQFFYPGSDGDLFFKETLSSNLYLLNSGEYQVFSLEFPEDRIFSLSNLPWDESKPSIHMVKLFQEIRFNNFLNLGDQVLDLGDLVFVNFYEGGRLGLLAFDKVENKARIVSSFKNDMDGVIENLPAIFPTNFQANQMIINLSPTEIYSSIEMRKGINPYQDFLTEILPSLEENPVLFIYRKK